MQLDVLVKNKGSKNWTIVSGSGALVNPDNFAQVIRNVSIFTWATASHSINSPTPQLSVYRYDANLKPKGSLKIPFHFTASVEPPVDVGLLVLFDYYESGKEEKPYRGVAHSAVVKVVYTDSAFDLQRCVATKFSPLFQQANTFYTSIHFNSIFLYIMGLATLAGAGYLIKNTYFVQSVKKTKRASISVVKTNSADPQSADTFNQEWIPDHVLRQQKSGKSPSIRKRKA